MLPGPGGFPATSRRQPARRQDALRALEALDAAWVPLAELAEAEGRRTVAYECLLPLMTFCGLYGLDLPEAAESLYARLVLADLWPAIP